jgi:hypothetical protein
VVGWFHSITSFGALRQVQRHVEAEGFGCLEVDDQLDVGA